MKDNWYLNLHGDKACTNATKYGFQNVANPGKINNLKGLETLAEDIEAGLVGDGDVLQCWVKITKQAPEAPAAEREYVKADGTVVKVAAKASEKDEVPF
jgi:hypothetical protein